MTGWPWLPFALVCTSGCVLEDTYGLADVEFLVAPIPAEARSLSVEDTPATLTVLSLRVEQIEVDYCASEQTTVARLLTRLSPISQAHAHHPGDSAGLLHDAITADALGDEATSLVRTTFGLGDVCGLRLLVGPEPPAAAVNLSFADAGGVDHDLSSTLSFEVVATGEPLFTFAPEEVQIPLHLEPAHWPLSLGPQDEQAVAASIATTAWFDTP